MPEYHCAKCAKGEKKFLPKKKINHQRRRKFQPARRIEKMAKLQRGSPESWRGEESEIVTV
jgi:hypothetical protein